MKLLVSGCWDDVNKNEFTIGWLQIEIPPLIVDIDGIVETVSRNGLKLAGAIFEEVIGDRKTLCETYKVPEAYFKGLLERNKADITEICVKVATSRWSCTKIKWEE